MSVHLKVPMQLDGDQFATVKDGSLDEVAQNVAVICGTIQGERLYIPEFGISDQVFQLDAPDEAEIEAAVADCEPRARLTFIKEDFDLEVQVAL